MKKYTLKEWREKGTELFGTDITKWQFKCPACGNIASVQDFINLGQSDVDACNHSYNECIGRYTGAGYPKDGSTPCNWAAYGLLGTMGKGITITLEDDKNIEVFDFYANND